jgi:hypothetical protein
MPAANHSFSIEQGSDFQITFRYLDENNTRVNLTNYYVLFKFVTNTGQIYSFDNITKTLDYSLVASQTGEIVLNIPARITNTYNFSTASYDLDLQEPNEQYPGSGLKRYRFVQGILSIITRNTVIPAFDIKEPINGQIIDVCTINCSPSDATIYDGPRLYILDNKTSVGTLSIMDTRAIDTVEVGINGLFHNSPQDLTIFLAPPSGDKVLLFAHHKIPKYTPGFSMMFSDRALPNVNITNVDNGGMCRIINKTNSVRFDNSIPMTVCDESGCSEVNIPLSVSDDSIILGQINNENLLSSLSHLHGYVPTSGDWSLYVTDNDVGASGMIQNWKLIVTYQE